VSVIAAIAGLVSLIFGLIMSKQKKELKKQALEISELTVAFDVTKSTLKKERQIVKLHKDVSRVAQQNERKMKLQIKETQKILEGAKNGQKITIKL